MPTSRKQSAQNSRRRTGAGPIDQTRRSVTVPTVTSTSTFSLRKGHSLERKYYYTSISNTSLYHNGSDSVTSGAAAALISPLAGMTQGTSAQTRIGDDIFVKDVELRIWLSNKLDRPNVMYRVLAVVVPQSSATANPAISSVLPFGSGSFITNFPDTAKWSVIYDKIVNPDMGATTILPSVITGKERSFFHDLKIPFNAPVTYTAGGSATAVSNLAIYICAYDAFGSLAADLIASTAITGRVCFTDR